MKIYSTVNIYTVSIDLKSIIFLNKKTLKKMSNYTKIII